MRKLYRPYGKYPDYLEIFQTVRKLPSAILRITRKNFPDGNATMPPRFLGLCWPPHPPYGQPDRKISGGFWRLTLSMIISWVTDNIVQKWVTLGLLLWKKTQMFQINDDHDICCICCTCCICWILCVFCIFCIFCTFCTICRFCIFSCKRKLKFVMTFPLVVFGFNANYWTYLRRWVIIFVNCYSTVRNKMKKSPCICWLWPCWHWPWWRRPFWSRPYGDADHDDVNYGQEDLDIGLF